MKTTSLWLHAERVGNCDVHFLHEKLFIKWYGMASRTHKHRRMKSWFRLRIRVPHGSRCRLSFQQSLKYCPYRCRTPHIDCHCQIRYGMRECWDSADKGSFKERSFRFVSFCDCSFRTTITEIHRNRAVCRRTCLRWTSRDFHWTT
jgi:hypothetical protein